MMPKQVIGMPQETGLNLFLRSGEKQEKNVPQFVKQGTSQSEESRRRRRSRRKGWRIKKAADVATLRFSQLDPTDLWQGID